MSKQNGKNPSLFTITVSPDIPSVPESKPKKLPVNTNPGIEVEAHAYSADNENRGISVLVEEETDDEDGPINDYAFDNDQNLDPLTIRLIKIYQKLGGKKPAISFAFNDGDIITQIFENFEKELTAFKLDGEKYGKEFIAKPDDDSRSEDYTEKVKKRFFTAAKFVAENIQVTRPSNDDNTLIVEYKPPGKPNSHGTASITKDPDTNSLRINHVEGNLNVMVYTAVNVAHQMTSKNHKKGKISIRLDRDAVQEGRVGYKQLAELYALLEPYQPRGVNIKLKPTTDNQEEDAKIIKELLETEDFKQEYANYKAKQPADYSELKREKKNTRKY